MMENLFKEEEAIVFTEKFAAFPKELAMRVYTSRLIGNNNNLVLHGGGNTSVKTKLKNIIGDEKDVLFIKGSGKDLSTIGPEGFVGLNLDQLLMLRHIESIPDSEMDNQLKIHRISSQSPDPSVETLLHAFLPHKYVDHTHADSILILTNQKHSEDIIKEALGLKIAVVPYTMSGLPLAKSVIEQYEKDPDIDAIVIINHGIFTFSESAGTSYENMIDYVSKAEAYIEEQIQNKPLMTPPHRLYTAEKL